MFEEKLIPPRPPTSFVFKLLYRNLKDFLRPTRKIYAEKIIIQPNKLKIWAFGHATILINFFGKTILTDPILSNWLPFIKRHIAFPFSAEELPHIDFIVLSHAHHDHLHKTTLRRLSRKTSTIIIPKNCSDLVLGLGFQQVIELDWGKSYINDIAIRSFKSHHWGLRYPWEKIERGYNAYVFERNNKTIFFAGDTGYGSFFREVGKSERIDYAILPIGAYNDPPTFLPHHMDARHALAAFKDLKAKHLIPIHWGNFRLSLEPIDEPIHILKKITNSSNISSQVHILENGQSFCDPD